MATRIRITCGEVTIAAELDDSATGRALAAALPFEGWANRWGDEIYFEVPVELPQSPEARQLMEVGELGYWPVGRAFCIFFGPTPVSTDDRPRAYSPVNPFGRLLEDPAPLRQVRDGDPVRVEAAD